MRDRFLKYGKSVRKDGGVQEHAEISIELNASELPEDGFARAKQIINSQLGLDEAAPLKASLGDLVRRGPVREQ